MITEIKPKDTSKMITVTTEKLKAIVKVDISTVKKQQHEHYIWIKRNIKDHDHVSYSNHQCKGHDNGSVVSDNECYGQCQVYISWLMS